MGAFFLSDVRTHLQSIKKVNVALQITCVAINQVECAKVTGTRYCNSYTIRKPTGYSATKMNNWLVIIKCNRPIRIPQSVIHKRIKPRLVQSKSRENAPKIHIGAKKMCDSRILCSTNPSCLRCRIVGLESNLAHSTILLGEVRKVHTERCW